MFQNNCLVGYFLVFVSAIVQHVVDTHTPVFDDMPTCTDFVHHLSKKRNFVYLVDVQSMALNR